MSVIPSLIAYFLILVTIVVRLQTLINQTWEDFHPRKLKKVGELSNILKCCRVFIQKVCLTWLD